MKAQLKHPKSLKAILWWFKMFFLGSTLILMVFEKALKCSYKTVNKMNSIYFKNTAIVHFSYFLIP